MRRLIAMLALSLATAACEGAPIVGPAPTPTAPSFAKGGNPNPGLVIPLNKKYESLAVLWWQYVLSVPPGENPLFDPTGANALIGQPFVPGNVIFLVGTFGPGAVERSITIPMGTKLFFPIVNTFAGCLDPVAERPVFEEAAVALTGMSPQEVAALSDAKLSRIYVNLFIDTFDPDALSVTIDGPSVQGLQGYRAETPVFTIPSIDLLGLPGVECPNSVAAGYWMLLNPLPPGDHIIHFAASNDPVEPFFGPFALDVTYQIHVEP